MGVSMKTNFHAPNFGAALRRTIGARFRKYLYIYKATLIENLQYVVNILMGFISFIVVILIFMNLWEYMYSGSGNIIGGYTKDQMIWYVILTEMIWFGTRNKVLTAQISSDIKSGTIAYGINKPYNYLIYIIARHYGDISIKMILYVGFALIMGIGMVGVLPGVNLLQIILVIPIFFMAILVSSLIRIIISVLSFWIEDSGPFHWIYDKLILVLGTLFPVELFPIWLRPFIMFSPIFVVTYGPAKLVIEFSGHMYLRVITAQVIYITILSLILGILFKKGVKKLNVNGG
jgi:ABC-2 type transport system permease protein